ncbi:MAG: tyrosine-type recombinase/integrase [Phycisphaerales bacterium]|nr:tyrosine-type recombinase/integrase [Phycisphaerales bacterium]
MVKRSRRKPKKPHPTFPLTAHPNGQWCKKILGKLHFFGVWADPDTAHQNYLRIAEELHAGREPSPAATGELTIKEMGNQFLMHQMQRVETGQIGTRWFEDCRRVVRHFARSVGTARPVTSLNADDFLQYRRLIAKQGIGGQKALGVHGITHTVVAIQTMFKWAVQAGIIEQLPRFGVAFAKPSAADVRRSRAERERRAGKRLFTAEQIRSLLAAARPELKAAIFLGINGGFGNTDCSALPVAAVDLKGGVIDFERPKTAVRRVVPLWPETIDAIQIALNGLMPKAATPAARELVFRSERGFPLVRQIVRREGNEIKKVTYIDRLSDWVDALLKDLKLKRFGLGFYSLRHTFRTWADEAGDQHAIHRIMGHSIPGMSGVYIEEISIERLRRVVNVVRSRLWPQVETAGEQLRVATG